MLVKNLIQLPNSIKFIFLHYLLGLAFFSLFRLLMVGINLSHLSFIDHHYTLIAEALWMGFRFDTVVCCYFLSLPALVLFITELLNLPVRRIQKPVSIFIQFLFGIAWLLASADLPYFKNYNNRINLSILNWMDHPMFVFKMIFQESSFFIYFILYLVLLWVYIFFAKKINYIPSSSTPVNSAKRASSLVFYKSVVYLFFCLLLFIGMRGRIAQKSPIKIGTAYFSPYSFINQLGLNPVFTFIRSYIESNKQRNKILELMGKSEALSQTRNSLNITDSVIGFPIARKIVHEGLEKKKNVVLVLMESMSSMYLEKTFSGKNLCPHLDSLVQHAYSFDNFYSAGIHTYNGIYSSLYSYPALLAKHSMDGAIIPQYSGLPAILKSKGYTNLFFTTHDDQFDNVGGFLSFNGFDKIYAQKDYPRHEVLSTLGVPDHYLFEYAIRQLNEQQQQQKEDNKPFFAAIMTGSNHGPYIIPENIPFKPDATGEREPIVQYADWSIGHFIQLAAQQKWYDETIFVFVADHGAPDYQSIYDMPLYYNKIPCIIYSKESRLKPRRFKNYGGQIDLGPTICGMLNLNYINNTLGVDLMEEQRPYMYFSADDKIGVIDSSYFYIWYTDGRERLYNWTKASVNDESSTNTTEVLKRRKYGLSMIQTAQELINNGQTALPPTTSSNHSPQSQ